VRALAVSETARCSAGHDGNVPCLDVLRLQGEQPMGKYFIAWLLGVPAIVLLAIWFLL
jgi:hypothetical protein